MTGIASTQSSFSRTHTRTRVQVYNRRKAHTPHPSGVALQDLGFFVALLQFSGTQNLLRGGESSGGYKECDIILITALVLFYKNM